MLYVEEIDYSCNIDALMLYVEEIDYTCNIDALMLYVESLKMIPNMMNIYTFCQNGYK